MLSPRDRQLVVARIEAQWTYDEIAKRLRDADARRCAHGGLARAAPAPGYAEEESNADARACVVDAEARLSL